MIGGLTGVNRDVIPFAMAFGDHVELAGLNLIGLKRRGLSRETHQRLARAFRAIFYGKDGSIQSRARAAAERWPDVAEVGEMSVSSWPTPSSRFAPRAVAVSIRNECGRQRPLWASSPGGGDLPRGGGRARAKAGPQRFSSSPCGAA